MRGARRHTLNIGSQSTSESNPTRFFVEVENPAKATFLITSYEQSNE